MSNQIEKNKQIVTRLHAEGFNEGRFDVLAELIAPDFEGPNGRGPEPFAEVIRGLRTAFPDIHYTLEHVLGEGDLVAVRFEWRGTHRGAFRGYAPTGVAMRSTGFAIYQLAGGRVVRAWLETDRLGFLQ